MHKMNSLEQRKLLPGSITGEDFKTDIQAELAILGADKEKGDFGRARDAGSFQGR